jgi:hypothetical protein
MAKKPIPASLKQKMAASVVGSRASLIPQPYTPKPTPKPAEEVVPSVETIIEDAEELATLRELVARQLPLNAQIKALESSLKPINDRIKGILGECKIKAVCDGATINQFPVTRSTVDPLLLLAAGVDEETIQSCTKTSTSYTLLVTGIK